MDRRFWFCAIMGPLYMAIGGSEWPNATVDPAAALVVDLVLLSGGCALSCWALDDARRELKRYLRMRWKREGAK